MTVYLDSSAILKRYLDEEDSDYFVSVIDDDPIRVTSWLAWVEVRRNLWRRADPSARDALVRAFEADWSHFSVIDVDSRVSMEAARIAQRSGMRSLDAVHLGTAVLVGRELLSFVTADVRQARAARELSMQVQGPRP